MIKFIEFMGSAVDRKHQEMEVENCEEFPMRIMLRPDMVAAVRENIGDEGEIDGSVIYLIGGDTFWVNEVMEAVCKRLLSESNSVYFQ